MDGPGGDHPRRNNGLSPLETVIPMLLPMLLASQTGSQNSRLQSWLPFAALMLPTLIQCLTAMLTSMISRIRTSCTSVVTRRIQHTKHVGWWSYNDAGDDDDSGELTTCVCNPDDFSNLASICASAPAHVGTAAPLTAPAHPST
jgi:hypothetical protein